MYYSIFDGEDYLNTGRNSQTREQCIQDGIDFVFEGSEEVIAEGTSIQSKEILLNNAGYTIVEHQEEITDYLDIVDESMDGDFDSAMSSAGFGTDEDYGYFDGRLDYDY